MTTRSRANRIAAAAFFLAFLIVVVFAERGGDLPGPRTTTTVEKQFVPAVPPRKVTTTITFAGGRRTGSTRTIEVQPATGQPAVESTTTTESEPRSFVERALGDDLLLYVIALLAALLTAAAIQRVLLGRYGGLRSGGADVQEIAAATADAQRKLPEEIAGAIGDAAARCQAESRDGDKDLRLELARMYNLIVELEKRIEEGKA